MSVIYFKTTASDGAETLRAALRNASDGDVITADETAFDPGAVVVIPVDAPLLIDKRVTINPRRKVVIDGQDLHLCMTVAAGGEGSVFYDMEFTRGLNAGSGGACRVDAAATFNRCAFTKSSTTSSTAVNGVYVSGSVAAVFNACLFTAASGRALYGAPPSLCVVTRCTVADSIPQSSLNPIDSVFIYNSAAAQIVIDATAGNYHLKPTASQTTGATDTTVLIDCDGNPFRVDGSGSLGCYENYDTHGAKSLFWREDAASGRVDVPANWSTSRFGSAMTEWPESLEEYTARILEPRQVVLNDPADTTEDGEEEDAPAPLSCDVVVGGSVACEIKNEATTGARSVFLSENTFIYVSADVVVHAGKVSEAVDAATIRNKGNLTLNEDGAINLDAVELLDGGRVTANNSVAVDSFTVPANCLLSLAPGATAAPSVGEVVLYGGLAIAAKRCAVGLVSIPADATGARLYITAPAGWSTSIDVQSSLTVDTSNRMDDGAFVTFDAAQLSDAASVTIYNPAEVLFSLPSSAPLGKFYDETGTLSEYVARRGAPVSTITATTEGRQALLTVERGDDPQGDYLVECRAVTDGRFNFVGRDVTTAPLDSDVAYEIRAFDGETFAATICPRKYFYIGSKAEGDFQSASDWSIFKNGSPCDAAPTIAEGVFVVE